MEPILRDIPDSFETERLIIRVPRKGEGAALQQAIAESLERLRPWFPWAQEAGTVEERETFIRQKIAQFLLKEDILLGFYSKEEGGKLLGGSGLHVRDWKVPAFEIGYWIRTGYEGKGYVSELVEGVTRFGFEVVGANRILIRCDVHNIRSQAVARRCGYVYEGTFRNFERRHHNGELTDMIYFAMTRSDYETKQKIV
ncbi:MAG: GNAT family N-acetyltransferase [Chloroflexi bacterium HGW-Chloroflexi-10]|nr:MAG: GNAT family N-acetyltransferase [Chloroflexi bacterium HGW-Chloroflexi-10]